MKRVITYTVTKKDVGIVRRFLDGSLSYRGLAKELKKSSPKDAVMKLAQIFRAMSQKGLITIKEA